MFQLLLIVPYGIETKNLLKILLEFYLLIVPYGIETLFGEYKSDLIKLLIVPYGIETYIFYASPIP